MTRRGTGIHQLTHTVIRDGMRHRLTLSWIDAVQRGGVHCLSIWLKDSEGLSECNMLLLEEAAAAPSSVNVVEEIIELADMLPTVPKEIVTPEAETPFKSIEPPNLEASIVIPLMACKPEAPTVPTPEPNEIVIAPETLAFLKAMLAVAALEASITILLSETIAFALKSP